jgi:V/A-type H+-transporting ATPase subunit F
METTIQIAIVGSDDAIQLFNAVGIRAFPAKTAQDADKIISRLANKQCKIIYVTETIYEEIAETIERYRQQAFPILIPIPSGTTSKGIGLKKIQDNVENAIGIDIF